MPTRLSEVNDGAIWEFNHDSLSKRPELSVHVARVVTTWAYIDSTIIGLVSRLLVADFEAVAAMLMSLSSPARRSAVDAAAKAKLTDADFSLYRAVNIATKSSRESRNRFAHHLWGCSTNLPRSLLLLDPKKHHLAEAQFREAFYREWPRHAPTPGPERWEIDVYDEEELKEAAAEASRAH